MTSTDRLLSSADFYRARYGIHAGKSARPSAGVAIVCCMDSRIDIFGLFKLELGEAHVIRNAGGIVTNDVLRSLTLSQRLLGTTEIILVHHTECGLDGIDDAAFEATLVAETGQQPHWKAGGFADVSQDVQVSMARIQADPFIPSKIVRGFVFDVADGRLHEITAPSEG